MIKNSKILTEFEADEAKHEKFSYAEALKIFEAMWQEGISLGVLPQKNPLDGIETDIKIAKILNSCSKNS